MTSKNKTSEKGLLFVYEIDQLEDVIVESQRGNYDILALDFWVEREFAKRGVSFISSTQFRRGADVRKAFEQAETIAHNWYRTACMSFFKYKKVSLGETFEPMLDLHIQRVFYFCNTIGQILEEISGYDHVAIMHSSQKIRDTMSPIVPFSIRVPVDVTKYICTKKGIPFRAVGNEPRLVESKQIKKQILVSRFYNFFISLLPRKRNKLFVSDYWGHISPFIDKMPDTEVTLMDRRELFNVPYLDLLRYRVRIRNPIIENRGAFSELEFNAKEQFEAAWEGAKKELLPLKFFQFGQYDLWDLLEPVFSYYVCSVAPQTVAEIESLRKFFSDNNFDKVVLRASLGATQIHFYLISQVAREFKMPTVELQHSNEINDPTTIHSRLFADYLAAYGEKTREVLVRNHEYAPQRIQIIGSPRFDSYASRTMSPISRTKMLNELELDPARPVVFCGMPADSEGWYFTFFDSYEVAAYIRYLRELQVLWPQVQFICKFRQWGVTPLRYILEYAKLVFVEGGAAFVEKSQDVFGLILLSDAVFAGNSTLTYEAMIARRPVVLTPLKEHDVYIKRELGPFTLPHNPPLEQIETLKRLFSDKLFYENRLSTQNALLEKYAFDGKSSERIAKLLQRSLTSF